jgi:hypothetical protein
MSQSLTVLAVMLRERGSGPVHPFTLRDRAIAKPVERDLFGWAVRETAEGKG